MIAQSHNSSNVFVILVGCSCFLLGLVCGYLGNELNLYKHNEAHFNEAAAIDTSAQRLNRYRNEILDLIQSYVLLRELKNIEHPNERDNFTPDLEARKLIANRIERVARFLNKKSQSDESIKNENQKNMDRENNFVPIIYTTEEHLLRNFIHDEERPEQLFELKMSIDALLSLEEEVNNGNRSVKKLAALEQSHSARLSMIAERILRKYHHRFK